ncbi:TrbG/VirB9 family P-type conjugative transfer protein [Altererythrobacter aquiaggeris]|uniref:TrbG/VirB9 family P-type conjugative transfer protein n=1 Tax=Aestuarierythrobacter aquiaggeris TaxID=1898396 RepID=UPI003018DBAF
MMRAAILAPALALAPMMPMQAHAQDARLIERMYDPGAVVLIEGKTTVQATIQFDEDERIENVAIGDSQSWQVTPNKRANLLFVKPLAQRASTNMTVVTDKHTYLFDLVANPRARPLYVLRFSYPPEPEQDEPAMAEAPSALEIAAASDPYAVSDPAALNFAWVGDAEKKADRRLLPDRTYDDGQSTYLAWPGGKAIPAILIKNEEGTEGPVNFTVRGETIIIDGVPREIFLRSGDHSAVLVNRGPPRATRQSGDASLAGLVNTAAEKN